MEALIRKDESAPSGVPDRWGDIDWRRVDRNVRVMQIRIAKATQEGDPAEAEPSYDEAEMLKITPRQYEVLVLLARGRIKTVSRMLNISVATVKSHACTLYQRLKVRNKGEAVYAALQRGATLEWVSGDERVTRDSSMRPVVAHHSEAGAYEAASPTL